MLASSRTISLASSACLTLAATLAQADVLTNLATERSWMGYTPRVFNPNTGLDPTEAQLRADLEQLYDDGWRHIYNYSLDGDLQHFPRIAKEVGFETVLAGIFFFDEAQLAREKANATAQDRWIDGYIVGNEGLAFGRYGPQQLIDALIFFNEFGKPITTTEVSGLYLAVPELLDVGSFATINLQPWFNPTLDPADPVGMAEAVRDEYVAIKELRPDRLVVIKEAWWPTGGHPAATEENQVAFYRALAEQTDAEGNPLLFLWGESYDQPWKFGEVSPFGTLGDDWGLYEEDGSPKLIVDALRDVYTSRYPVIPEPTTLLLATTATVIAWGSQTGRAGNKAPRC